LTLHKDTLRLHTEVFTLHRDILHLHSLCFALQSLVSFMQTDVFTPH
jgi:hypothetical protein